MISKNTARALAATLAWALAVPAFAGCDNADDSRKTFDALEADLQAVLDAQKEAQTRITREYQDQAAARGWTKERGSRLFADLLASPTYKDFEKQKQPYFDDVMNVIHMGVQSNGAEDVAMTCRAALKLGPTMDQLKSLNAREIAFMLQQVRDAK